MKQIKMYGLGGQGVVTAAKLFCGAVTIHENEYPQAIPVYGHERRGAPVYSDAIVSRDPIKIKGFVYSPDYVIIFGNSVMGKGIDVIAGTTDPTVYIVVTPAIKESYPFKKNKVFWMDAQSIALKALKANNPNTAILGALAGAKRVGIDAIAKSIEDKFKKAAEANLAQPKRFKSVTEEGLARIQTQADADYAYLERLAVLTA